MPVSRKVRRPLAIKAFRKARRPLCGPRVSPMPGRLALAIAKTVTWPRSSRPPACAEACELTPSIRNAHKPCGGKAKRWSANALTRTEPAHARYLRRKTMHPRTSNLQPAESAKGEVLIPLIRAAATIGFAIAPCSLGFVIIAVSEHLIRSIMVGDDPEMLMSDLQNQFPSDAFEIIENDDAGLVTKVVDLIERPEQALQLPVDIRGTDLQIRVWEALQKVPVGTPVNYTFLAEQIGAPNVP